MIWYYQHNKLLSDPLSNLRKYEKLYWDAEKYDIKTDENLTYSKFKLEFDHY